LSLVSSVIPIIIIGSDHACPHVRGPMCVIACGSFRYSSRNLVIPYSVIVVMNMVPFFRVLFFSFHIIRNIIRYVIDSYICTGCLGAVISGNIIPHGSVVIFP